MSEKELPAPLTAPDCDLRSLPWFPLQHKRLIRSKLLLRGSDAAVRISLIFWCEAYEQVPAASLPDDDFILADIAGFGVRNVDAWLQIKEEVMSYWTLCSDGRWYNPTLAEVAIEAWEMSEKNRVKWRKKKAKQRGRVDDHGGTEAVSPGDKFDVPGDSALTKPDHTKPEKRDSESLSDSAIASATVKPAKAPAKPKAPTKRAARAARETPIVWDWTPDEIDTAYAVRKGYSPVEARAEGEKFFAYYRAKGTRWVDWRAVWRKWILNNITGGPQGGNGSSASNRVPADDRRKAQHQDRVGDMLAGAMDALDGLRR